MATPLHSAIRWNKPRAEIEQLLGEYGVLTSDDHGNHPIHIAAQNGHADLVELVIAHRCDVNVQNNNGQTPLHMAVAYDLDDVEALLRDAGARGDICNSAGHPANLGIDGDLAQRRAVQAFQAAQNTQDFISSLTKVCTLEGIDSAKIAKVGLDKKKNYKESWTPDVQELFTAAVQGKGLPPGFRPPTPDQPSDATVEFVPFSPFSQAVSEPVEDRTVAYEPYVPPSAPAAFGSAHTLSSHASGRGMFEHVEEDRTVAYEPYRPPSITGSTHHTSDGGYSNSFKSPALLDTVENTYEPYVPPPAQRAHSASSHQPSKITIPYVIHPPHTPLSHPGSPPGFRSALEGLPKPAGLSEYRATNQYPPRPPVYMPQAAPSPLLTVHGLYRPAVPFATESTITSAAQLWAQAPGGVGAEAALTNRSQFLAHQRGAM